MLLEVFHVEHPVWGFAIGFYVLAPMVVERIFVLSYGYQRPGECLDSPCQCAAINCRQFQVENAVNYHMMVWRVSIGSQFILSRSCSPQSRSV